MIHKTKITTINKINYYGMNYLPCTNLDQSVFTLHIFESMDLENTST